MNKTIKHDQGYIEIRGNRVNNLKNIDLSIPRGKLTVISGVSGSGKSSLAFDTLYAEGQRRYVESLSSYARQFLDRMPKPDCDFIRYIPPAVAIQQRVISRNPRSTVGTSTEIYDYLKMLFARFGKTISPISGTEVKKHTPHDVVKAVGTLPEGTRIYIVAPLEERGEALTSRLQIYQSSGFSRVWSEKEGVVRLGDFSPGEREEALYLVVDRMSVRHSDGAFETRLADSVEIAFYEGHGACSIIGEGENPIKLDFSNRLEADGITFAEPSPDLFDFNSATGACPECEGYGKILGLSPNLIIPNPSLSIYEDAVACWIGPQSSLWKKEFMALASKEDFPIHTPYKDLSEEQQRQVWRGFYHEQYQEYVGINSYFKMLEKELYKVQNRVRLAHFRGKTICPSCGGRRLRPEALYVQFEGKTIDQITQLSILDARNFFEGIALPEAQAKAAERLLYEIRSRLQVLCDVGVEYLTLDRLSNTLSGGESQRITLSTRLGSNLYGAMYVLDEPSIGLHERDTERLIGVVERLRDAGNTIVVVEHDEKMICAADTLVDIGPDAGIHGGEVIYVGSPKTITKETPGYTAGYLSGRLSIPIPTTRRAHKHHITIHNAQKNNLQNLTLDLPLGVLAVVTGISGSGKSTLVRDVLYEDLRHYFDTHEPGSLSGDLKRLKAVEYVDQNMAGRNARSNPATFIGAFDSIRELYSRLPLSRQMGYKPSFFSFNNKNGGRCEECKGEGTIAVEMQFMADLILTCDTCGGKRFKREILEVEYHGVNISDLLTMSISEAVAFFQQYPEEEYTKAIVSRLKVLEEVGLGYVQMGQSCSTLSGGENQRLKLAYYLAQRTVEPTLFIFDEPTTGLHFHDISRLLHSLQALIEKGHSVLIIEHNLEIIKCADYVIDLGPEGGAKGGLLMACGTPEEVAASPQSITGQYLREKLQPLCP